MDHLHHNPLLHQHPPLHPPHLLPREPFHHHLQGLQQLLRCHAQQRLTSPCFGRDLCPSEGAKEVLLDVPSREDLRGEPTPARSPLPPLEQGIACRFYSFPSRSFADLVLGSGQHPRAPLPHRREQRPPPTEQALRPPPSAAGLATTLPTTVHRHAILHHTPQESCEGARAACRRSEAVSAVVMGGMGGRAAATRDDFEDRSESMCCDDSSLGCAENYLADKDEVGIEDEVEDEACDVSDEDDGGSGRARRSSSHCNAQGNDDGDADEDIIIDVETVDNTDDFPSQSQSRPHAHNEPVPLECNAAQVSATAINPLMTADAGKILEAPSTPSRRCKQRRESTPSGAR